MINEQGAQMADSEQAPAGNGQTQLDMNLIDGASGTISQVAKAIEDQRKIASDTNAPTRQEPWIRTEVLRRITSRYSFSESSKLPLRISC